MAGTAETPSATWPSRRTGSVQRAAANHTWAPRPQLRRLAGNRNFHVGLRDKGAIRAAAELPADAAPRARGRDNARLPSLNAQDVAALHGSTPTASQLPSRLDSSCSKSRLN